jgi:hypothetical protein
VEGIEMAYRCECNNINCDRDIPSEVYEDTYDRIMPELGLNDMENIVVTKECSESKEFEGYEKVSIIHSDFVIIKGL